MIRPLLILSALLTLALFTPADAGEIGNAARPTKREVKGDLTLSEAVAVALRQNPDVLKQIKEIERTQGRLISARSAALPHISLLADYNQKDPRLLETQGARVQQQGQDANVLIPTVGQNGRLGPPIDLGSLLSASSSNTAFNSTDKTWQITFQAQQVIYAGGQIVAGIRAQKFVEESAYYQLRDVVDQTVATVRSQFYTVLTDRSLITVAEETVKLQEDLLKDQTNRFEAGTVPRFNVLRAEVELANVIPNLIRAKNDYLLAEIALAKTLGLDPGPGGKPEFTCVGELTVSKRPFDLIQALDLAKARRPFLKVQRQQIKIQGEQVKIAIAGYLPQLNANGGYMFQNSRFSDRWDDTIDGWFFGFTGSWDIFDGFDTYGKTKSARAQLESARINYRDSVQRVELEVQTAYANLIAQRETIRSQQKNVEQAKEALRLANERLAAGAGTQLEVLDARVALTRAQTTELSARGDYNKAVAEFDRATATDTTYVESFRDPLQKLEAKILGTKVETVKRETVKREPGKAVISPSTPAPKKKKP
jgi:outer membrane protein TolC